MFIEHSARDIRLLEHISTRYDDHNEAADLQGGTSGRVRYRVKAAGHDWVLQNLSACSHSCGGGWARGQVVCSTLWRLLALVPEDGGGQQEGGLDLGGRPGPLGERKTENDRGEFAITFSDGLTESLKRSGIKRRRKRAIELSDGFAIAEEKSVILTNAANVRGNKTIYSNGVEEVKLRFKRTVKFNDEVELIYFDTEESKVVNIPLNSSNKVENKPFTGSSPYIDPDAVLVDIEELKSLLHIDDESNKTGRETNKPSTIPSENSRRDAVLCDSEEKLHHTWSCNSHPCDD